MPHSLAISVNSRFGRNLPPSPPLPIAVVASLDSLDTMLDALMLSGSCEPTLCGDEKMRLVTETNSRSLSSYSLRYVRARSFRVLGV